MSMVRTISNEFVPTDTISLVAVPLRCKAYSANAAALDAAVTLPKSSYSNAAFSLPSLEMTPTSLLRES